MERKIDAERLGTVVACPCIGSALCRSVLCLTLLMLVGCQRAPNSIAVAGVPRIEHVSSLRELRNVEPLTEVNGWLVRVGWSEPGADASGWRNLYCHLEWTGQEEPHPIFTQESLSNDVGPLLFLVRRPNEQPSNPRRYRGPGNGGSFFGGCRELVFWANFPTDTRGDYLLEVYAKGDEALGQTTIHIPSDEPWYWSAFATSDGEDHRLVDTRGVRAMPWHDGDWVFWKLGLGDQPAASDLDSLPCLISMPTGAKPPLTLTLGDQTLVVASGDQSLPLNGLLARWWVNGVAVNVPPQRVGQPHFLKSESGRQAIGLVLPPMLGHLRVGDKVAVQVMRTPRGMRSLYDDTPRIIIIRTIHIDWHRYPSVPLLSNRLEFTVTQEMLKLGQSPSQPQEPSQNCQD